jgi:MinD superfamily P-loop ATPase
MQIIAVTGGKGGTGKSTFAIFLAFHYLAKGKKVLLVDCDVECPNDYIILGREQLRNPVAKTYTHYPLIDKGKCTKCGKCVINCKSNAIFQLKDKVPTIDETLCSSCGVCWTICPEKAIEKKQVENGEIFLDKFSDKFRLLTGRSRAGVRETSPIVKQTRDYASKLEKDYDICIIDTAAGTHCTVISALEGAEEAYAVTEPTPLGAHDLKLILEVLKVLKIPSSIVLNQCDIGDESKIGGIAKDSNTKIKAKIPYSEELARVYSEGKLFEHRKLLKLVKFI